MSTTMRVHTFLGIDISETVSDWVHNDTSSEHVWADDWIDQAPVPYGNLEYFSSSDESTGLPQVWLVVKTSHTSVDLEGFDQNIWSVSYRESDATELQRFAAFELSLLIPLRFYTHIEAS